MNVDIGGSMTLENIGTSNGLISLYIRDISYLLFIIIIYIDNCKMQDISLINE